MTAPAAPEPTAPPHAIEAELGLLGAILHNEAAIDAAREHVRSEDFFEDIHRQIFEAMCQRRDAGESIDLTMMKAVLGDHDLGGLTVGQYLGRLMSGATTVSGASGYAKMITCAAHMRRVVESSQVAIAAMSTGVVFNPSEHASQLIEVLDEVVSHSLSEGVRRSTLGEAAGKVIDRVERVRKGVERHGVPFGIPTLDRATLGARDGQLIVMAGRPGMAKTMTSLHMGLAMAKSSGAVGFVSLEMNDVELAERVLAAQAYDPREMEEITYRSIAEARGLSHRSMERIHEAERLCRLIPFWIEQQPGLSLAQISARARQMKLRAERKGIPLAALFVDHLGLVKPSRRYAGNRVQEMTEITGGLKGLAKDLSVPIIALSQLSRNVETREDKRPTLPDLRDSGSIEQDADVVLGLYRDAYYLDRKPDLTAEEADRLARNRNTLEIEILKQRSGPTIRIPCFCNVACNVIGEMAR